MKTTPRSSRLLLLSTVLLAVAGVALLAVPHGQEQPAPAPRTHATTAPSAAATVPPAGKPTANADVSATSAASAVSSVESALPPHGEGAAGDPAVQRNLEASWPADLPSTDERELLATGRALLRADATGIGRTQWPAVFPASAQAVAPAFATAGLRIQASIARRDGSPDKAVVHLVWAGMDRGGTFTDLRITDWYFIRTLKKGAPTWAPQPRM